MAYVGPDSATPRRTAFDTSIGSKSPLGEALPQITEVLTISEDLVGLNNGISSIEERRTTLLKLQAIQYKPNHG
jgi:hypothetical protein